MALNKDQMNFLVQKLQLPEVASKIKELSVQEIDDLLYKPLITTVTQPIPRIPTSTKFLDLVSLSGLVKLLSWINYPSFEKIVDSGNIDRIKKWLSILPKVIQIDQVDINLLTTELDAIDDMVVSTEEDPLIFKILTGAKLDSGNKDKQGNIIYIPLEMPNVINIDDLDIALKQIGK